MKNKELIPGLENLLIDLLSGEGLELVELSCRSEGQDLVMRVIVERLKGGVTMGECVKANRLIGDFLEEKGIIRGSYVLEVNSPGLDRPLKTKKDFSRCLGRQVKFFLIERINGKIEMEGSILQVLEDGIQVCAAQGVCFIPFLKIHQAKQLI